METNTLEYKQELTDGFEKEVVAFLNSKTGGKIVIGMSNAGTAIGVSDPDDVMLRIKDKLKHNILPACLSFIDMSIEINDGKQLVCIEVFSAWDKPYYISKFGMSPRGCYVRVGTAAEPMSQSQIELMFSKRVRNSMVSIPSPRNELTFNQLKIYYEEKNKQLNQRFLETLELFTPHKTPNYAAYLLADENGNSIKFAKYLNTTRVTLIENEEYGYCCLVKAFDRLFDRLIIENKTFAKITEKKRLERRMIEPTALREAVLNALLHNDYVNCAPPKVEMFSDRLEITSMGGLPIGVSVDDFFSGLSAPRNKELMRVFRDLELAEHLGSGVPRILDFYSKEVFTISENFIRITFPFENAYVELDNRTDGAVVNAAVNAVVNAVEEQNKLIVDFVAKNPGCRKPMIAAFLKINVRTLERYIKNLVDNGRITFKGAPKSGGYYIK